MPAAVEWDLVGLSTLLAIILVAGFLSHGKVDLFSSLLGIVLRCRARPLFKGMVDLVTLEIHAALVYVALAATVSL